MLKVRVVLLLPEDERARPCGRLSAGRRARRGRSRRRAMGLGATTARPGAAPTRCPARKRLFLPMRTGRGADRRHRHRPRRAGPAADARPARLLDALADQAALAIERVSLAEDIDRARAAGGDRPAALGAADLDLARSADAARLDPRRRHHLRDLRAACSTRPTQARSARAPSSTKPSGSTASSPTCST